MKVERSAGDRSVMGFGRWGGRTVCGSVLRRLAAEKMSPGEGPVRLSRPRRWSMKLTCGWWRVGAASAPRKKQGPPLARFLRALDQALARDRIDVQIILGSPRPRHSECAPHAPPWGLIAFISSVFPGSRGKS